jgi:hypothetical protein
VAPVEAQARAGADESALAEDAQPPAQRLGSGDEKRTQLAEAGPADRDRSLAGAEQDAQRLPLAGGARARQRLAGKDAARGAQRIECVALQAALPALPARALDLDHTLATCREKASETGAVGARALECPQPALAVGAGEPKRAAVAARVGVELGLAEQGRACALDQRELVMVTVGIDADHDVEAFCEHAATSSRWGMAPVLDGQDRGGRAVRSHAVRRTGF